MRLPSKIKIGGMPYNISRYKMNGESPRQGRGFNDAYIQEIGVATHASNGRKAADEAIAETLLHEILHGCWWDGQLEDKEEEEKAVSVLSARLFAVFKNNPKLKDVLF